MCLLMVLCKCACAHLIWKAHFNLISKTDLVIFLYINLNFIPNFIPNSTGQKYRNVLDVRSERLLSIVYRLVFSLSDSKMGYVHVFAGSQVCRPVSYLQITNILLFKFTSLSRLFHSYRDEPIVRWGEKVVPQKNHLTHPQAELGLSYM